MNDDELRDQLSRLGDREAVLRAWKTASYAWEDYSEADPPEALSGIAGAACEAARMLADDGEFWSSLPVVLYEAEERQGLAETIDDLDELIGLELEVASTVLGTERGGRLYRDLTPSLGRLQAGQHLHPRDFEQLRNGVERLASEMCAAAEEARPAVEEPDPPSRWKRVGRIVRLAGRVTLVTAGGALVVLNGLGTAGAGPLAPLAIPGALGSVVAGAEAIKTGVSD
jgi:hypothetical protein